jgi:hypothetical protein
VATAIGVLAENLLCPPRIRDELRTGWLVQPGNASELARTIGAALALDVTAYEALGARATIRRIHVFAVKRCRSYSWGLYVAARMQYLTDASRLVASILLWHLKSPDYRGRNANVGFACA